MPDLSHRVLVVDDDPIAAESLAEHLREEGFDTATAFDGAEALAALDAATRPAGPDQPPRPFGVLVCDVAMPHLNGMQLLARIQKEHPTTVAVMVTGYGRIEEAVDAVQLGAVDYLTKPIIDTELRLAMKRAVRQHTLVSENHTLKGRLERQDGLDNVVGNDHRMLKVYELVEAVAPSRTTVLMTGESGVGKSLVARAIHHHSPRADQPFIELACGSIPETLLESELFGHIRGAFTGAHADKVGRFLAADGGTIFLDEINSASPGMQLKLLRVLQERKFEPVGSTETIEVDVRVVLAANQPLEDLVAAGTFRQDLYYRINVLNIDLPPLRDRISDVMTLAAHFLERQGQELERQFAGFSPDAIEALCRYTFPGNVRELENIIERAAVLARAPTIAATDLPDHVAGRAAALGIVGPATAGEVEDTPWEPIPLDEALKAPERAIILKALRANEWNRQRTAEQLEINRTTLYKKMKALGIDASDETRLAG